MAVKHLKSADFTAEMEAASLAMVDFWADWCGPCKMLSPAVESLAAKYGDQVLVGKINVDEEMELAVKFGISSIPTLIVMKDGALTATLVGYRPKADIEKLLQF